MILFSGAARSRSNPIGAGGSEAAEVYNPFGRADVSDEIGAGGFLAALERGEVFPQVELETESGARFVHPETETLYGFFKTTCPTSELSWPHLDRIRRIGEGGLATFAVSQDGRAETSRFNRRLGVALETLYDPEPWNASAALGLRNVPTFFLVGSDRRIRETVVGFSRPKLQELARRAGKLAGRPRVRLFPIGEHIPLIAPG